VTMTPASPIREAWRRKQGGEPVAAIARDYSERRLKLPDGREWAPKRKKEVDPSVIWRALAFYENILARGLDLGDDGV